MSVPEAIAALIEALVELARELPPSSVDALARDMGSSGQLLDWKRLSRMAVRPAMRDTLLRVQTLHASTPDIGGQALSLALQAAARTVLQLGADQRVEIAWTGPGTESVPVRRVGQVVYELVESAKDEVLLVTYAAYRAERALRTLRTASERGVRVRLVIELAQESGGKIAFDGLEAIRSHVPDADVFYWSLERRARDPSGAYGTMHAKAVVADRIKALVSSANLTDHALQVNMELGLIVEGAMASQLAAHFDQLVARGELIPAP